MMNMYVMIIKYNCGVMCPQTKQNTARSSETDCSLKLSPVGQFRYMSALDCSSITNCSSSSDTPDGQVRKIPLNILEATQSPE